MTEHVKNSSNIIVKLIAFAVASDLAVARPDRLVSMVIIVPRLHQFLFSKIQFVLLKLGYTT